MVPGISTLDILVKKYMMTPQKRMIIFFLRPVSSEKRVAVIAKDPLKLKFL
jgi:hypothetical protein